MTCVSSDQAAPKSRASIVRPSTGVDPGWNRPFFASGVHRPRIRLHQPNNITLFRASGGNSRCGRRGLIGVWLAVISLAAFVALLFAMG